MGARCDCPFDLKEMQVHRFGITGRHDEGSAFTLLRTDGSEDVGRGSALIAGSAGTGAAFRPPARDLVFLADTRFVLEPNLYRFDIDRFFARDFVQARGEAFLKSSIAPSAWA